MTEGWENFTEIKTWQGNVHYISLKSLGRKDEPFLGEMSRKNKMKRKVVIETMVLLSASIEVHRRSLETNFQSGSYPVQP